MNFFIKSSLFIGSLFVLNNFVSINYPLFYNRMKMQIFFLGIRTYSKYQVYYNKTYLFLVPYYSKMKKLLFKTTKKKRPNSKLLFYKDQKVIDTYDVDSTLLPVDKQDKDDEDEDEEVYDANALSDFITNVKPSEYDFYVIENINKKLPDVIIRIPENETELENPEYSKTEFLVIQLNINGQTINMDLTDKQQNFNILGNRIDKHFIYYYLLKNSIQVSMDTFTLFIVDRNADTLTLNTGDSVQLMDKTYKTFIRRVEDKNTELKQENYEIVNLPSE